MDSLGWMAARWGLTKRRLRQVLQRWRQTGVVPTLNPHRRPPSPPLTEEEKRIITAEWQRTRRGATKLWKGLARRGIHIPKMKIYRYALAQRWTRPNPRKRKRRSYVRYERKHSGSLLHGDWHRTSPAHPYVILWEDDASRKVLSGGGVRRDQRRAVDRDPEGGPGGSPQLGPGDPRGQHRPGERVLLHGEGPPPLREEPVPTLPRGAGDPSRREWGEPPSDERQAGTDLVRVRQASVTVRHPPGVHRLEQRPDPRLAVGRGVRDPPRGLPTEDAPGDSTRTTREADRGSSMRKRASPRTPHPRGNNILAQHRDEPLLTARPSCRVAYGPDPLRPPLGRPQPCGESWGSPGSWTHNPGHPERWPAPHVVGGANGRGCRHRGAPGFPEDVDPPMGVP